MKLAEALLLRADLQKKIASLKERIARYSVVQEGDRPAEDPKDLLAQSVGVLKKFEETVFKINDANLKSKLPDGRSLTEAIAARDVLIERHSLLNAAITSTAREPNRYGLKEVKWVYTVDIASLQKQAEDLAKHIRELNARIQETNWSVEIDLRE
jgi:hypothetical protein